MKKNEVKKMTVVFDVESIKPITPSIKGKIRKNELVDNLEERGETGTRLRITNCQCMFSTKEDPGEVGDRLTEEMEKMLHSISKALEVKRVYIFAP